MLSKCANPPCNRKFRYLHQGKLFVLKSAHKVDRSSSRVNFAGHVDGIQYAWLCDKCAGKYEVALDPDDRVKVRPLYEFSGIVATLGVSIGLPLLTAASIATDLSDLLS